MFNIDEALKLAPQRALQEALRQATDLSKARLFAVFCARQVQHLSTDPRVAPALNTAERFALGLASREELLEARKACSAANRKNQSICASDACMAARDACRKDAIKGALYAQQMAVMAFHHQPFVAPPPYTPNESCIAAQIQAFKEIFQ